MNIFSSLTLLGHCGKVACSANLPSINRSNKVHEYQSKYSLYIFISVGILKKFLDIYWQDQLFFLCLLYRWLLFPLLSLRPRLPPLSLLLARRLSCTTREVLVETGAGTGGATNSQALIFSLALFFCICTLGWNWNGGNAWGACEVNIDACNRIEMKMLSSEVCRILIMW